MLHPAFIERLFLALIHHFSNTVMLIICLCATFSTYATVAKVCHKTTRLKTSAINLICVDDTTNSLLLRNDLFCGTKLDAVEMFLTGFSRTSWGLSAQKHASQNGTLRLLKLNFDRSKLAISSLSP